MIFSYNRKDWNILNFPMSRNKDITKTKKSNFKIKLKKKKK